MSFATQAISILGSNNVTGTWANQLGWDASNENITFVVNETVRLYGVDTEAQATDLDKAYAILEYALWKQVHNVISTYIDYSADGESFKMSQSAEVVEKKMLRAKMEATAYLSQYKVRVGNAS